MELYLNDVYPYAQQISNYIEREIFQQKLKAGQKLLSITNLSKELNVSKHGLYGFTEKLLQPSVFCQYEFKLASELLPG